MRWNIVSDDNIKVLDSLKSQLPANVKDKKTGKWDALPPLHLWNPPLSGEMDLVISTDGRWIYEGNAIKREKIIQLFSRILKVENGEYFLVTPVEKWKITVEDSPWIITSLDVCGGTAETRQFFCTTNIGDRIELSADHSLIVKKREEGDVPYINVRQGLLARFNRQTYYQLSEFAEEGEDNVYRIFCSGGNYTLQSV